MAEVTEIETSGESDADANRFLREVARAGAVVPRAPERDRTGETIGRYRLTEKLGQGGMGIVYAATDATLRRSVALKLLPDAAVAEPARRAMLVREARSASSVNDPRIATIYDAGEIDGTFYIAMERVRGRTLRHLLADHPGGIGERGAAEIVREIARGVAKAHEAGVVHRDLKPENVMRAEDGAIKILDFGLAKLAPGVDVLAERAPGDVSKISRDGRVAGTPRYMSPEQAKGDAVDARADVYALGVVLRELATGGTPGRDDPDREKTTSRAFGAIVRRSMQADPSQRYADAGALAAALDGFVTVSRASPLRRAALFIALVAIPLAASAAFWPSTRGGAVAVAGTFGSITLPSVEPAPTVHEAQPAPSASSAGGVRASPTTKVSAWPQKRFIDPMSDQK